jgi:hypothetical protein
VVARSNRAGGTRKRVGESKDFTLIPLCFSAFCCKKGATVFSDTCGYALMGRRSRDAYVKADTLLADPSCRLGKLAVVKQANMPRNHESKDLDGCPDPLDVRNEGHSLPACEVFQA